MMFKKVLFFGVSVLLVMKHSCLADVDAPQSRRPLKDVCARYGFLPQLKVDNTITLKSKSTKMVFKTNSRKLMFNEILIWMNSPLTKESGKWTLTNADIAKIVDPLLRPNKTLESVHYSTVVLDPGHGGDDIGAIGRRKVYEKKVVLDIAKRLKRKLQKSGVNVKLTREKDSNLSLSARTALAKEWKADIFVSIHINSAHNTKAQGIETYVVPAAGFPSTAGNNDSKSYPGNKYDASNMLLAYYVHKEMLAFAQGDDRGIRRARFDVIRDAPCSAILVECGFVSNKAEEKKMLRRKYRDNVAEGIAKGILIYINEVRTAKSQ